MKSMNCRMSLLKAKRRSTLILPRLGDGGELSYWRLEFLACVGMTRG